MATDETASPLEQIVRRIVRAYPVPAWSAGQASLWLEELADLDIGMLAQVARTWIRTKPDRPTIADIRKGVADLQLGNLTGSKLFLPPDEAWKFVDGCFGTVGQYREFPNTHPLVRQAVDRMGWISMCMSTNKDVLRGQFRHAYAPMLERALSESAASEGAASAPASLTPELEQKTAPQLEPEKRRIARGSNA